MQTRSRRKYGKLRGTCIGTNTSTSRSHQYNLRNSVTTKKHDLSNVSTSVTTTNITGISRLNLQTATNNNNNVVLPVPSKLSQEEIDERNLILDPLVSNLVTLKMNSNSFRVKRSQYTEIVNRYKSSFPWMTKEMLKQRVKRRFNRVHRADITNKKTNQLTTKQQRQSLQVHNQLATANNDNSNQTSESIQTFDVNQSVSKGGRPLGSTKAHAVHVKNCINMAKVEICSLYKAQIESSSKPYQKSRTSNQTYKNIVTQVKKK
jgi:DNA-binding helix-hairpin-helix protein with protein kinase domain